MTAEILPFPSWRFAPAIVESLPGASGAMPVSANVLARAGAPADAPSNGVAVAALTLVAACRELTASLAILSAHCDSTDRLMAEIGDGAAAIAKNGEAVGHLAAPLGKDAAACLGDAVKAERDWPIHG